MYFYLTLYYNSGAVVRGAYMTFQEVLSRLEEYSDSLDVISHFEIKVMAEVDKDY